MAESRAVMKLLFSCCPERYLLPDTAERLPPGPQTLFQEA